MTQSTVFALCAGGLVLGFIAVIVDRLNFPQKRFMARGIRTTGRARGPDRDRTGAHIVDLTAQGAPGAAGKEGEPITDGTGPPTEQAEASKE